MLVERILSSELFLDFFESNNLHRRYFVFLTKKEGSKHTQNTNAEIKCHLILSYSY